MGFLPRKSNVPNSDSSDDEDDDVIIDESDDEDVKNPIGIPALSSTIRTPLKELSGNAQSILIEDSFEENSANASESAKIKVSRSHYEKVKTEKENLEMMRKKMEANKMIMKSLPDGGAKLKLQMEKMSEQIKVKQEEMDSMIIDENLSVKSEITRSFNNSNSSSISYHEPAPPPKKALENLVKIHDVQPVFWGKQGQENFNLQKASVEETLQNLVDEVNARPERTEEEEQPEALKIDLMKHQKQALRFMLWRETQRPRGGILADDMGLGKTLTVISLILRHIEMYTDDNPSDSESEDDEKEEGWSSKGRSDLKPGGNLIICPASLVKQWEHEIQSRVKGRNYLSVNVFHGPKRAWKVRDLAKYDVVLTSYQLVASEFKNDGILFKIKWKRIVLDEGHVIRNHKSKASQSIFELSSKYRWVLTGTPIQNKEFDVYATMKFLRLHPFDDVNIWNKFMGTSKNSNSPSNRLPVILEALMLRRTKVELMESGEIDTLPEKIYEMIPVDLNKEEKFIYTKVMMFSQAIFANYLQQKMEKDNAYSYDQTKFSKVYRKMAQQYQVNHEIKTHEILVLLMRLRQACCHCGLIKQMLEHSELNASVNPQEEEHDDVLDMDLMKQIENLKLNDDENSENDVGERWNVDNPVFNMDMPSSKIEKLMEVLREHVLSSEDKAIIVSQFTSYLSIIRGMLEVEGVTYCELNGTVPVKSRNDIVQKFNDKRSGVKIMLLSLTAGGVGLNLVGANYLMLMDLHWNPQLEQQAQDRIYRFGQKKNVKIFKFICNDTIEKEILLIQNKKLDLANCALTGQKSTGSKLTLGELKNLFGFDQPAM